MASAEPSTWVEVRYGSRKSSPADHAPWREVPCELLTIHMKS